MLTDVITGLARQGYLAQAVFGAVLSAAGAAGTATDTVILLTATARVHQNIHCLTQRDADERVSGYVTSILQWLSETSLPIVVVENSGYDFPQVPRSRRLEVLSFKESDQPDAAYLQGASSKGKHEFYAIDYALRNSRFLSRCGFVVKVTGRYFVPQMEGILAAMPAGTSALRQQDPGRCEIVGASAAAVPTVFHKYAEDNHVEDVWRRRLDGLGGHVLSLPSLPIPATRAGGNGSVVTEL